MESVIKLKGGVTTTNTDKKSNSEDEEKHDVISDFMSIDVKVVYGFCGPEKL